MTDRSESANPTPRPARVLVVEDHPITLEGIRCFLSARPGLKVVGEATTGEEALTQSKLLLPDIVLMDTDLPGMDGLEATRALRAQCPDLKVVLLSAHAGAEYVLRALQVGASAYLLKDVLGAQLASTLLRVAAGESPLLPQAEALKAPGLARLTEREREILICVVNGKTGNDIASRLGISLNMVDNHRETIRRKLNIRSTAGLTTFAIANGLIGLTENPGEGGSA